MEHAQVTTVTSREFAHNVSAAKRVVSEGGTVIVTDRGEATMAIIPMAEYRRLMRTDQNLVDLLRMPDAVGDIDFEPIQIEARDIDA